MISDEALQALSRRIWERRRNCGIALFWLASFAAGMALAITMPLWLPESLRFSLSPPFENQAAQYDPIPGRVYRLPPLYDLQGRAKQLPTPGRPACLLFAYQCNACETGNRILYFQENLWKKMPNVDVAIVVIRGEPKAVRAFWKSNRLKVPVLLDRNAVVSRELNAIFATRLYLFDSDGRLRYVSSYRERLDTMIPHIQQLARS